VGHGLTTLVFDEGPGIGLGHRRRAEVLAGALGGLGIATALHALEPGACVSADVLVVDSYLTRADDCDRFTARTLVAIEDLARDLAVDLVIDPDPGADPEVYTQAAEVRAGPHFALIDSGLRLRDAMAPSTNVDRVLVTMGAADAAGVGARIASELATFLSRAEIRLVVGPWGADCDDNRVVAVHAPDGLADELVAADVVVTAGGVTMLEACCLGRPTVALAIAPNQTRAVAGAAHAGALLAADEASAASVAARLAHDRDLRTRLSLQARALIDGQGAARVAAAVATIASQGVQSR
jgi:UDP-2,4-diacetamido-2,4,6-trideoxy-beta-L-altropyranose hydrolase